MPHELPLLQLLGRPHTGAAGSLRTLKVDLELPVRVLRVDDALHPPAISHESRLLDESPSIRRIDRTVFTVKTTGWTFQGHVRKACEATDPLPVHRPALLPRGNRIRTAPTPETHTLKDRLLFLLQPPLDGLFHGRQLNVPFPPFPYQLEGIAFLMPRHAALLADEMGLGKTAQAILALRLLFHQGLMQRGLVVCPKPLVPNWSRELSMWAPDVPFEVVTGDGPCRKRLWQISNCPLKLVNYETLCRDTDWLDDRSFDLVVLDEAQRIKNRGSRTSMVVRSIRRERSWALTGTPIENHPDDLANLFAFVDPGRVPPDTPPRLLSELTGSAILRRTKDLVQNDMPPKMIVDVELELTAAQRTAYDLAEDAGVIHLNELGQTLTVQHVFQLVMRLKQICNFDPLTGESAKLERLLADMEEVADSGRKAIVFSQWVEPLEKLAAALWRYKPLLFHGRVPQAQRMSVLSQFQQEPDRHVILMTYGTGSVGLNLQFANYVFLFDRWWNPAVEDQAINRAHRIGQTSSVTVKRFVSSRTIEQRIADVLEAKRQIFQDILCQSDKPASLGLSEEEIFSLFDIRQKPQRHTVSPAEPHLDQSP